MSDLREQTISNGIRDEVLQLFQTDKLPASDIVGNKEARRVIQQLAKVNLYFLVKAVLGYDLLTENPHKKICHFVEDPVNKKSLLLLPRGVYKSTIGTIGYSIKCLLNNKNLFILIGNQIVDNASTFLVEIEQHFERNPVMAWLFPEMMKPGDRHKPWSDRQMTVPGREIISGTPSITAVGTGGKMESQHYHIEIVDDPIGREHMQSPSEMKDASSWLDGLPYFFVDKKTGILHVIGTRWGEDDIFGPYINDSSWKVFCMKGIDVTTGELFFPKIYTKEIIEDLQRQNFSFFCNQVQNDPVHSVDKDFKLEWLKEYTFVKEHHAISNTDWYYCKIGKDKYYINDMDVLLVVDPAATGDIKEGDQSKWAKAGKSKKANNGVAVWGKHWSGIVFLLDAWTGRVEGQNPELQCAKKIYEMACNWQRFLRMIYIEAYGMQKSLITVFNMLMESLGERRKFLIAGTDKGEQRAKDIRIRSSLGPLAESGCLACRYSHIGFKDEWQKFPHGMKDLLDTGFWAVYYLREGEKPAQTGYERKRNEAWNRKRLRTRNRTGY